MKDNLFDDDFDEFNDLDNFSENEDETDIEKQFKKSIGKIIAEISFEVDEGLYDILHFKFTDKSTLVLRCSRKSDENFIFADEESFPKFIGAKVIDVEVFEDYSGDDIFNADLEYVTFKTDKGDLEIDFENGGKFVGKNDDFDKYEEEYQRYKYDLYKRGVQNYIFWQILNNK